MPRLGSHRRRATVSETVAVVGSREGADLEHVSAFLVALMRQQPDTILLSGGARGVDKWAEQTWLSLGGRVRSLRPRRVGDEDYAVEEWQLGGRQPQTFRRTDLPTGADYSSACLIRDIQIADEATRVVAFFRYGLSRGAGFTAEWAEGLGKPTYKYEREPHE